MSFFIRNFNIRVVEKEPKEEFFSSRGRCLLEIKSDTNLFKFKPKFIQADPFLFVFNGELYLFYEHQDCWFGKGRLCMRKTSDLITWTPEVDILIEPFHLSFPNVFEHEGKVYMLPETGANKKLTVYEAVNTSLTQWKPVKDILDDGRVLYDSTIYKKDGVYYLFTGSDNEVIQEEFLYTSDNLYGPYKEHPCSPIYNGRDGGRNAGRIIEYCGRCFRPVQVCLTSYGEQTSIMRIEKLSTTEYEETVYKTNIIDTTQRPYGEGGHQFNAVEFKGKIIAVIDYRERNYNFIEFTRRILDKLGLYKH